MTILIVSFCLLAGPTDDLLAKLGPVLDSPPATGLLVFEVSQGSQAENAGIQVGDILTHFDGQPIARHQDLIEIARESARAQKSELVLLLQRGDQQVEAIVKPGSLGVRLEDVIQGEKRSLGIKANRPVPAIDTTLLASEIARGSHRYWLVDTGDPQTPIGWSHHYLVRDAQSSNTLRVHQMLKVDESNVLKQEVVLRFELDNHLSPVSMSVRTNDVSILEVVRDGNDWVGSRSNIPTRSPFEPGTTSAYLLPYLIESFPQSTSDDLWIQYLPPASLQSAPLCRLSRSREAKDAVDLWKLGRREVTCSLKDSRAVSITFREGMRMHAAQAEEIEALFPDWKKDFEPIDRVPNALVPRSQRAN